MTKNLIKLLIISLILYFLLGHFNDGERLVKILLNAKLRYVFLALSLQAIYFYLYAKLYKASYEIYEINWTLRHIIPLILISIATGVVTPLGALTGPSVLVHKAKKEGYSEFGAAAGYLLVTLIDFLALFLFLTLSIFFLFTKNALYKYELLGYLIFVGMIIGMLFIITVGFRKPKTLEKMLEYIQKITNKLLALINKKPRFRKNWFEDKSKEYQELSINLVEQKAKAKNLIFYAIGMHLTQICSIFFLFLAFGKLVHITPLIVGYSIGSLFLIVSPMPQGIGFVETLMPLAFSSLGVDIETSTLVTLAYRGLSLWLPVLLGFFAIHFVQESAKSQKDNIN